MIYSIELGPIEVAFDISEYFQDLFGVRLTMREMFHGLRNPNCSALGKLNSGRVANLTEIFANMVCALDSGDRLNLDFIMTRNKEIFEIEDQAFKTKINMTKEAAIDMTAHDSNLPNFASIGWSTDQVQNENMKKKLSDIGMKFAQLVHILEFWGCTWPIM